MATIKYDGQTGPSNLITYTDIPNILSIKDTGSGTKATFTLTLSGSLSASGDSQYYISFMGETITNVIDPKNAVSKYFYIASSNASTAAQICRALRNCPTIAANFNTMNSGSTVTITAKAIGPIFSGLTNYYDTNISSTYLNGSGTDGTAASSLFGAKVDVDIYSDGDYVTTLEKNYYGSEVAFNISPVLTTISELGKTVPYNLSITKIASDGEFSSIGSISTNYSTVGYMVNQGYKYNLATENPVFAQNMLRGSNKDWYNNSILYVYEPLIAISCYRKLSSSGTTHINLRYLDSTGANIGPHSHYDKNFDFEPGNLIQDMYVTLDPTLLLQAHYIELEFEDMDPDNPNDKFLRYNVIKPLKATEYCQRVYFRNSYGGISFFDFTGQKSETRDLDVMTYEKNIFDYYTSDMNDLEKVYDNTVKYTVTLKSHLIENDGKYIFNDMLQSPEAWVERNGEKYAIIIDSISVDETNNNNNIYEATLKYHYSQEPSLI